MHVSLTHSDVYVVIDKMQYKAMGPKNNDIHVLIESVTHEYFYEFGRVFLHVVCVCVFKSLNFMNTHSRSVCYLE